MTGTDQQTAAGKVLWHFTMSLDGFVAGPNHAMDWMTGVSFRPPSTSATGGNQIGQQARLRLLGQRQKYATCRRAAA